MPLHPSPITIGHVGIAVADIDRSVAFYEDVLGFTLTERFEYPVDEVGHGTTVAAGAFVRCDSNHHCLSIFSYRQGVGEAATPFTFGLHHIAFELPTPEDLLGLYRTMKDAGAEIVNARKGGPGNQPRFYARDPDNNLLEFYWGIDQIGWDGTPRRYEPIEEIDLENYSFEEYLERRTREAAEAQAKLSA
ncbi:MAG TPA: VOC family protein [Baekduia sp.]|nr:VOC family protein [Baekduia sp.]